MTSKLPVIILGAGGHAKVLIDALRLQSIEILGIVEADSTSKGHVLMGVPIVGNDDDVMNFSSNHIRLVNGIGSTRVGSIRRYIFESFKDKGYQFQNVIHPSAIIAGDVELSEGVQVMAGAVIQTGCKVGANSIINTRASVDHDCLIGKHVHIAPGATLSGGVIVGGDSHVGSCAVIIQGLQVGSRCLVAAGAVVIRHVPDEMSIAGVPARKIKT
jgi:sugar O-acyltransferase (sialic acid O-acetyltransferase NeuD family)